MTQIELPLDLEKESQDDWLPRFLSSEFYMEELLTPTPWTPTSQELTPEELNELYSGNESLNDITTSIRVLPSGTNKLLPPLSATDSSQFLVDGFTRSSLFRNGESGSGL